MMLIIMLCHRSFTPQVPPVHSDLERAPMRLGYVPFGRKPFFSI